MIEVQSGRERTTRARTGMGGMAQRGERWIPMVMQHHRNATRRDKTQREKRLRAPTHHIILISQNLLHSLFLSFLLSLPFTSISLLFDETVPIDPSLALDRPTKPASSHCSSQAQVQSHSHVHDQTSQPAAQRPTSR
mmetsp:Transcript_23319/g.66068  ORF Transcript_23319/g.66068 Transcript_23319/m.66068 type:complete len:137 (+) Transcript_23319:121-531(+)